MKRILGAIDRYLAYAVSTLLAVLLLTMVGLSFFQVFLRNLFDTGIPWADVVLRHMVLWVGMFGATLATRQGRQISIDALSRFIKPKFRRGLSWIVGVFTLVVTYSLARASVVFVSGERAFGSELPGTAIPVWVAQLIIPIGFSLIGFQLLLNLALGRSISFEASFGEEQDRRGNRTGTDDGESDGNDVDAGSDDPQTSEGSR